MTLRTLYRPLQILAGTLLGLAAAFWWLGHSAQLPSPGVDPVDTNFLDSPLQSPAFTLTSHTGESWSSEDSDGRILAVFFGYTSCPDICPLTLTHLTEAYRLMGENGDRVQVILITVDPIRDTPERLASFLGNFHPSFLGLSGTIEQIREVSDGFGAYFSANGTEGNYTVDHTARIFIVDSEGRIPLTFPVTSTPEEIARDLTTLLDTSQSSPS